MLDRPVAIRVAIFLPHRSPIWPPMVRLPALISRERRIEVPALHRANRSRHIAVTGIRDALQGRGQVEQKGVTACHSQRASRLKDSGELCVGKRDRPHVAPEAGA